MPSMWLTDTQSECLVSEQSVKARACGVTDCVMMMMYRGWGGVLLWR